MDINEFISKHNITIRSERVASNPNFSDWRDATHWKVTLKRLGSQVTIFFSQGLGFKGLPPELPGVLECLACDLSCDTSSFEVFCSDLGYNPDSIKDLKVFRAIKRLNKRLTKFFGLDIVDELIGVDF